MSFVRTVAISSANVRNLRDLFLIRMIAIAAQGLAVALAVLHYGMQLPLLPIAGILIGITIINSAMWWRIQRRQDVTQAVFFFHLLLDIAALTVFLYFTGGGGNPLAVLYILPLTTAIVLLPGHYTWPLAGIIALCYSLLMWFYTPLPAMHTADNMFHIHIVGMWLTLVLLAALLAYFVAGMRNTLLQQQQALATAREQQLRDERLLAVGTLAAGTAHELGTPLGTMALLLEEMAYDCPAQAQSLHAKIATMSQQVERCKQALGTLAASAGDAPLGGGRAITIDRYLDQLLAEWRALRPNVTINTDWQDQGQRPMILADRSLSQALCNILDNAADASPHAVEWHATWDNQALQMEIRDRGNGLDPAAQAAAGKTPYSNKRDGLGLGLFLAHAIIDRFGGSILLRNHEHDGGQSGVSTLITLPLASLIAESQP